MTQTLEYYYIDNVKIIYTVRNFDRNFLKRELKLYKLPFCKIKINSKKFTCISISLREYF